MDACVELTQEQKRELFRAQRYTIPSYVMVHRDLTIDEWIELIDKYGRWETE